MAQALELFRSAPRFLTARTVGGKAPGLVAGPLAPIRLVNQPDPMPSRDGWARVKPLLAGICGSDLSTLAGKSSFYFSPLVTLPFVPGHEVVGELLDDCGDLKAGTRVVLSSVLGCAARGLPELCPNCAAGEYGRCDRVTVGELDPGLQTGYCKDTGGGWSRLMLAHRSQLWAVPAPLSDEAAVLIEPLACAIHSALRAKVPDGGRARDRGGDRWAAHPDRAPPLREPRPRRSWRPSTPASAPQRRWPAPTRSSAPSTR